VTWIKSKWLKEIHKGHKNIKPGKNHANKWICIPVGEDTDQGEQIANELVIDMKRP